MKTIETMKVRAKVNPGDVIIINKKDFDPEKYEIATNAGIPVTPEAEAAPSPRARRTPPVPPRDLGEMTRADLSALAKDRGVAHNSRTTKKALVQKLRRVERRAA